MATKKVQDARAARERKQKIVLIVGGLLLVGLAVIQGPKLMKQLKGTQPTPAATAPAAAATPGATPASGSATSTPAGPTSVGAVPGETATQVPAPKNAKTELAGVLIVPEQPVRAGTGQLQSLSRFDAKDPFSQQVDDKVDLPTPAEVAGMPLNPVKSAKKTAVAAAAVANASGKTGSGSPAVPGAAAAPAAAPTMAMLKVNGKLMKIDLKARFPKSDRAFVLRSLKVSPGRATIAVADGSFAGHQPTLTLRAGQGVTLVNTATGVRYVVKLLFVGSDPDSFAAFTAR